MYEYIYEYKYWPGHLTEYSVALPKVGTGLTSSNAISRSPMWYKYAPRWLGR
jgi:hypothetical protein